MTQLTAPSDLFDLRGKSALVSGASGALGQAAARALAGAGAHVTLAGGNVAKLDALAQEIAGAEKSVS
ncbi:MAG: gluconate 5-dehydrogenase, partial [Rhodospirillales bacterium]|nr:gluconate 5-dehydrogenase [Rhodospirillales bacterium]